VNVSVDVNVHVDVRLEACRAVSFQPGKASRACLPTGADGCLRPRVAGRQEEDEALVGAHGCGCAKLCETEKRVSPWACPLASPLDTSQPSASAVDASINMHTAQQGMHRHCHGRTIVKKYTSLYSFVGTVVREYQNRPPCAVAMQCTPTRN
jgi:hypothetical protein